jgi:NTP pyrophosphatase (non-canonical NTP hydrolase)
MRQTELIKFRNDRKWTPFHTPERLSAALHVEAGELAALFQWGKEPDVERIKEELADVAIYMEYIAAHYDLNIAECVTEKIAKNALKYPVDVDNAKVHGWTVR